MSACTWVLIGGGSDVVDAALGTTFGRSVPQGIRVWAKETT